MNTEARFFHMTGEDCTLAEIRANHTIPVYTRENEPLISQCAFVDAVVETVTEKFGQPLEPVLRVSHPIRGRRFEARNKKKEELLPEDMTLHYERMGFALNVPGFEQDVNGNETGLAIVGVKAYNEDTLTKSGSLQHFKLGIGRQVKVCLNMAICAEMVVQFAVQTEEDLFHKIRSLINGYSDENHLEQLRHLCGTSITQQQFANVLGRARLYDALPPANQKLLPELTLTDTQVKDVARGFYLDPNFRGQGEEMPMWNFYNLLTESVKTTYLDSFVERGQNCLKFATGITEAIRGEDNPYQWFLN